MKNNARWAAVLGFLACGICACSPEPSELAGAKGAPPGALRGELLVYSATFPDGTSEYQYFLRVGGNPLDDRRLRFATNPDLSSGVWLDVWGHADAEEIIVERFDLIAPPPGAEQTQRGLISAHPYRTRSIAFVLVDLGAGVNLTKEAALVRVMGTATGDDSVRQYFIEASFGRQDVAGQVFGPLSTTMTGCTTSQIPAALRSRIPGTFDQYFWYMGRRVSACAWSGLAMVGSPDRPARDTWFNGSSGCLVLVHEPGHNLGLKHASSMNCGTRVFVDAPNGVCTHSEYGDTMDAMGSGCRHMNAYTKTYQGWFGGCNMVDVSASGTFNLLPVELPCNGIQALQIKMPKTRPFYRSGGGGSAGTTNLTHYYVEFRAPIGFDGAHGTLSALRPQVQIRVSGDIRTRTQSGLNTWYLDMNPSARGLDGLLAGGSFTDPAGGITIAVEAIEAAKATVRIAITGGTGSPTCMDGVTRITAPGPGPESCASGPSVPGNARTDGGVVPPEARDASTGRDSGVPRDVSSDVRDAGASPDRGGLADAAPDLTQPDLNGTGGSSGTGGAPGTGGAAGAPGTGGAAGAPGTGGAAGERGSGGAVGSGGAAGSATAGGGAGGTGTGGSMAAAASGGSMGSGGSAGTSGSAGAGGRSGSDGGTARAKLDSSTSSGCNCAQAGQPRSSALGFLGALLLLALALGPARRRRC